MGRALGEFELGGVDEVEQQRVAAGVSQAHERQGRVERAHDALVMRSELARVSRSRTALLDSARMATSAVMRSEA